MSCRAVLATPDGGRTWTPITQLAACLTQCGAGAEQVPDIRCASPAIGYLYDRFASAPLMMTADGGHRWSVEPGRATVALDVSGGQATRVSASGTGCPGSCSWSIDEAALGSNAWNTVDVPATANQVSAQLARQGSASYTLFPGNLASGAGSQLADLYISQAGGAQWSHQSDPCGSTGNDPNDAQAIAAAPDRVLTSPVRAPPRGPGLPDRRDRRRSQLRQPREDAASRGLTAGGRQPDQPAGGQCWRVGTVSLPLSLPPVPLQRRWPALARGGGPGLRCQPGDTGVLGFQTVSDGRWIAPASTLWTTADSGASWTRSRL